MKKPLPVLTASRSSNAKIGDVYATYTSQESCPDTCPFLNHGCYAEFGPIYMFITKKVNESGAGMTPEAIAMVEAEGIRKLPARKHLRLHVVGDCKTQEATEIVAAAASEYIQRSGKSVWTYTHAWRDVPREAWGEVSVLASCETFEDAKLAMSMGYAAAVTVKEFAREKPWKEDGLKIIPCRYQTEDVQCSACKLCFKDDMLLHSKAVIAFAVHGTGKAKAANAIDMVATAAT